MYTICVYLNAIYNIFSLYIPLHLLQVLLVYSYTYHILILPLYHKHTIHTYHIRTTTGTNSKGSGGDKVKRYCDLLLETLHDNYIPDQPEDIGTYGVYIYIVYVQYCIYYL